MFFRACLVVRTVKYTATRKMNSGFSAFFPSPLPLPIFNLSSQVGLPYPAFSKPAGCRLNEPPPLEVWPSLFQTENILFLFCVTDKGKKAKRTPKKKLPENNLKVKKCLFSVPSVFTSRYFKQTSLRSFFGYESGNIHRFYRSIGKNVTFTSSIWLVIGK